MKITWLGQGGVLFDTGKTKVLIDPYLSDSVGKIDEKCKRRFDVPSWAYSIRVDILICTHKHLDHLDKETLPFFLKGESSVTVLGPTGSWEILRSFGMDNNYVLFDKGTEWSEKDVKIKAVKAIHSDPWAIGVILESEGKKHYVTGDTLYGEEILKSISGERFETLFLPINGRGNNMNSLDASRFASAVEARITVPIHYSLFDDMKGDELDCKGRLILKPFETIII